MREQFTRQRILSKKSYTSGSLESYSLEWVKYLDRINYTAANSNHS